MAVQFLDGGDATSTLTGTQTGGSQTKRAPDDEDNTFFGDVQTMFDSSKGGDDTIFGGDSLSSGVIANFISGDAWVMQSFTRGGDDFLSGGDADGNSHVTNLLYGDAFFMFDGALGGTDYLEGGDLLGSGGSVNNILVGDADLMQQESGGGGSDTLIGGDIASQFVGGLVSNHLHGDAQVMVSTSTSVFVRGGNDNLSGGHNNGIGDVDNFLYGDAWTMGVRTWGGNDTLDGGDNRSFGTVDNNIYGDGRFVERLSVAGHDVLTGGHNSGSGLLVNRLYGDAEELLGLTIDAHAGGNDILQGGGNSLQVGSLLAGDVINHLYGDVVSLEGTDRGGHDTIEGGDEDGGAHVTNMIYGDSQYMMSSALGGVDDLKGGLSNGSGTTTNFIYGDAQYISDSAVGVIDSLTGGDARGIGGVFNYLYGDAQYMYGASRAGFDILRGGSTLFTGTGTVTNFLYGDAEFSDPGVLSSSNILEGGNAQGGTAINHLYGGGSPDTLRGGDARNASNNGAVSNYMYGGGGGDTLHAGRSLDTTMSLAVNYLYGEDGDDNIHVTGVDTRSFQKLIVIALDQRQNFVDGGQGTDTFHVSAFDPFSVGKFGGGHFWIETVPDWQERSDRIDEMIMQPGTEIVVSYSPTTPGDSKIVAELDNIEDIIIDNTMLSDVDPTHVTLSESFDGTSLDKNTIKVLGSPGPDIIDLTRLVSAHGFELVSNGGDDQIMGGNANTKVILPEPFANYQQIINADGSLTLSSASGNSFTTDNHDIIIQDPNNQGAVDFNIAPVAKNDSFTTNEDTPLAGNLLADNGNGADSDWDNDQLTVQAVVGLLTAHGRVTINADGSFTYTPTLDFFGTDSFTYTVGDGQATDSATATVQVLDVNDPAIIGGDLTGSVIEDTMLIATGNLTISDVDSPDSFLAGPYDGAHGTLDLTEGGEWEYYVYNASGAVQGLDSGDSLIDEVVIQSADSTEQTISIIINGIDEQKGNPNGQTVDGTRGNDTITTGNGSDVVNGLPGDDVISTGQQDDLVQAGAGDDTVYAGHGDDTIYGDAGNDTLFGEQGADEIHGGTGDDAIHGGNDGDRLFGGAGQDQLFGENGDDVLDPGAGSDIMTGGLGNDVFVLDLDGSLDQVTDFEDDVDQIQLPDGIAFADLTIEDGASGGVSISVNGTPEMHLQNIADAAQITTDDFFVS